MPLLPARLSPRSFTPYNLTISLELHLSTPVSLYETPRSLHYLIHVFGSKSQSFPIIPPKSIFPAVIRPQHDTLRPARTSMRCAYSTVCLPCPCPAPSSPFGPPGHTKGKCRGGVTCPPDNLKWTSHSIFFLLKRL